jgi:MoaA/NifB/PqqE/SkfB family radical SAM enzyme
MFGLEFIAQVAKNPQLQSAFKRFGRLPEKRIALLMDMYRSLPQGDTFTGLNARLLKNVSDNPNALNWLLLLCERLADAPLRKFFQNLLINEMVEGQKVRYAFHAREGFEAPVTLVLNPTMACNLKCQGCYSYKMPKKGMDYSLLQKILGEARDMGCRFITVSGGEPFIYRHFFRMAEEFDDMFFLTYTNATLLDEEMADRLAQVGNVAPAISVEGFGQQTDDRRGAGVHAKVLEAMRLLKEKGVMFGFSATPTRHNGDILATDEFVDYYLEQGALFGWMFQYLPVGKDPDLSLMSTPEQRDRLRKKTREWHVTKPILIGDFWNDGPCVGGCLSATRYCYITPEGKVQPCTFVHFYTHDLNEHSLADVFRSRFFRTIRSLQPYDPNKNLLRPCKVIDNPEVLRKVVKDTGAKPSYPGAETIIEDPTVRAHLESYAEEWGRLAEQAWHGPEYQGGRSVLVPFLGRINAYDRFYTMRVSREERRRCEQLGGAPAQLVAAREQARAKVG